MYDAVTSMYNQGNSNADQDDIEMQDMGSNAPQDAPRVPPAAIAQYAVSVRTSYGKLLSYGLSTWAPYALTYVIRDCLTLIHYSSRGITDSFKTSLHLATTVSCGILGAFLPTHIWKSFGEGVEAAITGRYSFVSAEAAQVIAIIASILIVDGIGAKLSEVLLNNIFNKMCNTPDTILHFTEEELDECLGAVDNWIYNLPLRVAA